MRRRSSGAYASREVLVQRAIQQLGRQWWLVVGEEPDPLAHREGDAGLGFRAFHLPRNAQGAVLSNLFALSNQLSPSGCIHFPHHTVSYSIGRIAVLRPK
jgi:hypothetical protein